MNSLRVLASRLSSLIARSRSDARLRDEIQAHLDALTDDLTRRGMSIEQARAAARREFGGVEQMKEAYRDQRGWPLIDTLAQDMRYAVRTLRKNRGFSAVAVLTLALGIGANTAIFSVLNAVLLRSLPVPHPEELFVADPQAPSAPRGTVAQVERVSFPMFERFRAVAPDSVSLAAVTRAMPMPAVLEGGEVERVMTQLVAGDYFSVLALTPRLGRLLTGDDTRTAGGQPVIVISHDFWRRRFGASLDVLGRNVTLNGAGLTIVGIGPERFSGDILESATDLWIPATMQQEVRYKNNYGHGPAADDNKPWVPQDDIQWLRVVGRANRSVRDEAARTLGLAYQQDLQRRVASSRIPEDRRRVLLQQRLVLASYSRGFSGQRDRLLTPLSALLAMVTLTLLIACANTANLLLARATTRQREIAIRVSLGAARGRLIRQLLTESSVLVGLAAALGVLFGHMVGPVVASRLMGSAPGDPTLAVPLDGRVLGYTGFVSLATAALFGLTPAFRTTRVDPGTTLKMPRTMRGGSRLAVPKLLVAFQVALSILLVVGAGLFIRSFRNLTHTDLGFEPDRVISASINVRVVQYPVDQLPALYRRLVERIEALPGVQSAANSACPLATNCHRSSGLHVMGKQGPGTEIEENYVSPRFFSTVGMRLLAGRDFDQQDTEHAPKVAIVNDTLARQFFGGRSAIGAHLGRRNQPEIEIVGVVQEARVTPVRDQPLPTAYLAIQQGSAVYATALLVKATGKPERLAVEVRKAIAAAAPGVPIDQVGLLSDQVSRNVDQERLVAVLTGAFGLLALGLAGFGLFGVMSYNVAQRTSELGLRLALGAPRARVLRMVFHESLWPVALGLVGGLAAAIAAARLISGMLFGVASNDPSTIAGATAVLVMVAALAGFLPAWRASRVDPMVALRHE